MQRKPTHIDFLSIGKWSTRGQELKKSVARNSNIIALMVFRGSLKWLLNICNACKNNAQYTSRCLFRSASSAGTHFTEEAIIAIAKKKDRYHDLPFESVILYLYF